MGPPLPPSPPPAGVPQPTTHVHGTRLQAGSSSPRQEIAFLKHVAQKCKARAEKTPDAAEKEQLLEKLTDLANQIEGFRSENKGLHFSTQKSVAEGFRSQEGRALQFHARLDNLQANLQTNLQTNLQAVVESSRAVGDAVLEAERANAAQIEQAITDQQLHEARHSLSPPSPPVPLPGPRRRG